MSRGLDRSCVQDEDTFLLSLSTPAGIPSLTVYRQHGDGEELVAAGSPLLDVLTRNPYAQTLQSDPTASLDIENSLQKIDEGVFRIEHRLRARRRVSLVRCLASLSLGGPLDEDGFRFVPHLHPKPGMIAPDQIFRSPCTILESGSATLAVVPELASLSDLNRAGLRTAYILEGNTVTYGIVDHRVKGHVYFLRYARFRDRYHGKGAGGRPLLLHIRHSGQRSGTPPPHQFLPVGELWSQAHGRTRSAATSPGRSGRAGREVGILRRRELDGAGT